MLPALGKGHRAKMAAKSRVIGVLGGMGPHATAAFYQTLLDLTPAKKDRDHLRIIVDNNPHIPSRTRHFLYGEESPFPGMLECCKKLERYPVGLVALPCNSAAVFVPRLHAQLGIPVLNIIDVTANAVTRNHPEASRVAALGGYITYKYQTYRPFLQAHGVDLFVHGAEIQADVEKLIETLKLAKADEAHSRALMQLFSRMRTQFEAQAIVLACTEFRCLPAKVGDIPVIDSSLELARYTVRIAMS